MKRLTFIKARATTLSSDVKDINLTCSSAADGCMYERIFHLNDGSCRFRFAYLSGK